MSRVVCPECRCEIAWLGHAERCPLLKRERTKAATSQLFDRDAFVSEAKRYAEMGGAIMRAMIAAGQSTYDVYPDFGPKIDEDGLTFYDTVDVPYEDYRETGSFTVGWDQIDTYPSLISELEVQAEMRKQEAKEAEEKWDREQLARLKAKLGES